MDVGSSFRIYGDLFGWQIFGQIYIFILATGLWTIPFFFFFYQAMMGNRGGGEGFQYKAFSALKSIEINIYTSLILFALFLYPMIPIHNTTFIYNDGKTTQEATNTGTSYDDLIASAPDGSIKIPVGWYSIMVVTSGLNYVIKLMLPTGQDIRALMHQQQQMAIDDPDIKTEFNAFSAHCLRPANIRLNVISQNYRDSKIYSAMASIKSALNDEKDAYQVSPRYPGNLFFINHLYGNNLCEATDPKGLNSTCIPRTNGVLSPKEAGYGFNHCGQWWTESLKAKLKDDLTDKEGYLTANSFELFGNILDSLQHNAEDRFIYGKLAKANINANEKGLGSDSGGLFSPLEWIRIKLTALFASIGLFFLQFPTQLIKFMLPIILGTSIMVMTMLLPIMILFTQYKLDKIIQLVILFFGISFIPAIWHIAAWIDQILLSTIWGDRSFIEGVFSLGHAAWGIVAMFIYVLLTKWWLQFLMSIGIKAAQTVGGSVDGATAGANSTHSDGVNKAKQGASKIKKK